MFAKIPNTRLPPKKMHALITEFVFRMPARVVARKIGLNRNTVNLLYHAMREKMSQHVDQTPFSGLVEIDESYFGQKRFGVTGRGWIDRVPIFGIKQPSSGRVWACVVPKTDGKTLVPIIRKMITPGTIIHSDGYGAYHHMKKFGYIHRVVNHSKTYITKSGVHTNGIESFWRHAKDLFRSRRGLPRLEYQFHLDEAVFRFCNPCPKQLRLKLRQFLRSK